MLHAILIEENVGRMRKLTEKVRIMGNSDECAAHPSQRIWVPNTIVIANFKEGTIDDIPRMQDGYLTHDTFHEQIAIYLHI